MLDVHTHILPGIDDGSRSVEQSLTMLRAEAEQGVKTVMLTPHYRATRESPAEFAGRRAAAEARLREAVGDQEGLPALYCGAEVEFFEGLSHVEELEPLCIGGGSVMLIEMPFCPWNRRMLAEISALQQHRGVQPILAHIERYRSFQPKGLWEELSDRGVWLQCNTSFFRRWQTSRIAMSMLKRRLVDFVATDSHDPERRAPDLGAAMEKIESKLGREALDFLRSGEEALLRRVR